MKKRLFITLLSTAILCFVFAAAAWAENKTVILKIGDPAMTANGKRLEIDPGRGTKPLIIKGRTLVPIRAIVNQMGGTIAWDGRLRQVVIHANNKTIKMTLGQATAGVKTGTGAWTDKTLDVAPQSINGRTMLPLRFITEQLGAKVGWNGNTKTVTLTFSAVPLDSKSITGAWETNEGIIVFTQSGTTVTATYAPYSLGTITGSFNNGRFTGKWYADELEQGDIIVDVTGSKFTGQFKAIPPKKSGKYTYPDSGANWIPITGKRS